MSELFNKYSAYYDLLYKDKNYEEEADYINKKIELYSQLKGIKLLNLGCGTGKHDKILAEKHNYEITGIDQSESMIEIAKENNSSNNSEFYAGDIRSFRLNKSFDICTSLFHVVNYMKSEKELLAFFNTAALHLNKNGLLLFDSWYGPAVLKDPPQNRIKIIENNLLLVNRKSIAIHDKEKQTVEVNFEINILDKENNISTKLDEKHQLKYLFQDEVKLIAKKAGFDLISVNKWLTFDSVSDKDWYVLFAFKKK